MSSYLDRVEGAVVLISFLEDNIESKYTVYNLKKIFSLPTTAAVLEAIV